MQQKGLRLLLNLKSIAGSLAAAASSQAASSSSSIDTGNLSPRERLEQDCAVAMARVAISTDPRLYPSGVVESLISVLLGLLKSASHELFQFEACLALTNLARFDDDRCCCMCRHCSFHPVVIHVIYAVRFGLMQFGQCYATQDCGRRGVGRTVVSGGQ